MIGKLEAENERQMLEGIPLQIRPYSSGINYLHMPYGLSSVNQALLGKG
jgi:hypothetical protein